MSPPEKYGKRRQITFRIGPIAQNRLKQAAALFNMKPSQYAKAFLYNDLGVFQRAPRHETENVETERKAA